MLPEEIISKILVRLPLVSIVRCTCVCKRWLSLINSPQFISAHLSSSSAKEKNICNCLGSVVMQDDLTSRVVTLHTNPESLSDYKIVSCPVDHPVEIVALVDGVICLHSHAYDLAYLWNPAISKFLPLPRPPLSKDLPGLGIALGFVFHRNDHKVVRVTYANPFGKFSSPTVEIYSLNDRSWRSLTTVVTVGLNAVEHMWYPQHYMNGHLHWLASEGADQEDMEMVRSNLIVVFNVVEERLTRLEFPQQLVGEYKVVISETKGLLAIINSHYPTNDFRVWVMKEYGVPTSWTLIYSISSQDLELNWIHGFYGDENQVLVRKMEWDDNIQDHFSRLALYDPENNEFKDFVVHDHVHNLVVNQDIMPSIFVGTYVESLVLFDMGSVPISCDEESNINNKEVHDIDEIENAPKSKKAKLSVSEVSSQESAEMQLADCLTLLKENSEKLELMEKEMRSSVFAFVAGQSRENAKSVANCMKALNALEGVDGACYAKATRYIHDDPLWREMFLSMSNERKKDWVLNI